MNQNSGKTKTIIWVTLLLAVVVIGIGYAAISATNLNISGTASATGDTTDFVVKFDDSVEIATAGQGTTSGDIVNNTTAGIYIKFIKFFLGDFLFKDLFSFFVLVFLEDLFLTTSCIAIPPY